MGTAMAVFGAVESGSGQKASKGKPSWPVLLLILAVVTSFSLSALSLYQLMALRAEIEGLKSDVCRRRQEANEGQTNEIRSRISQDILPLPGSQHDVTLIRKRRLVAGAETLVSQPCLQLLANNSRKTFRKELAFEQYTGIPWQVGLRRGSALEVDRDTITVQEEGFFFVYSQVFYMDVTFAMGHVVIRRKRNVVGDELQYVTLFRCIQIMNPDNPYNTCYTGGIVKLEAGDQLELLIPRSTANVSLDGDATFLGAFKLA